MNLNKMFVFIFVFLVFSGILISTMPSEFIMLGIDASVQDKEVVQYFDTQSVLVYNHTYLANLTYPCNEQIQWGLPEDEKLEFWWDDEYPLFTKVLELRHLTKHWTGWWWDWHYLKVQEPYLSMVTQKNGLLKDDVLALWNEDYNASYCEFACEHIRVKLFIVTANESWTLEESWDNNQLRLFSTYDIDWTATGTSMWNVMGQLLAFQNPNLGIPGIGGTILTAGVGGALWACIALLFFALITSVIPFIRGWGGG